MKGLPTTYNRDMQEDKEPLFEAADQLCGSLEMARVVVDSAKLNAQHPAAAAEASWVVATDLAEALARNGTPFHQAHQIVGRLVLESVRGGKKPADWNADELVEVRAGVYSRDGEAAAARRGHEDARDSRRDRSEGGGGCFEGSRGARLESCAQAMNKSYRQGQILKLVRSRSLRTQDELARALRAVGIRATQVTLSRDIRELGLVKTAEGYARPTESAAPAGPDLATVLREFLLDVRVAQNLLVLITPPAHANSVAEALDQAAWPEIVGTIAGDNTVVAIAPTSKKAVALREKLMRFLG